MPLKLKMGENEMVFQVYYFYFIKNFMLNSHFKHDKKNRFFGKIEFFDTLKYQWFGQFLKINWHSD
jgi:hypothetical protein